MDIRWLPVQKASARQPDNLTIVNSRSGKICETGPKSPRAPPAAAAMPGAAATADGDVAGPRPAPTERRVATADRDSRAAEPLRAGRYSSPARSSAKYVRIRSAPARLIDSSDS